MEKPNLNYIDQLARGDQSIKDTLVKVIIDEFPEEKKDYFDSVKLNDFEIIASNIHRIKHKFSILGLEKSYKEAEKLEHLLREGSSDDVLKVTFENTLTEITKYLKTI
ncbi:MAG: Hpt domain-containing protein [Polaribacter sp.]|jgi:HPt (histidine-containing phosphotransfer) domain-containing protein